MIPPSRIAIIHGALVVFAILLVGRAAKVQLVQGDHWAQQAERQQVAASSLPAPRGSILDANGEVLAESREMVDLAVAPQEVSDMKALRRALTGAGFSASTVKRATDTTNKWVELRQRFLPEQAAPLLAIRGVHGAPAIERVSPAAEGLRRIVGMIDGDGKAIDGIELALDSMLQGTQGRSRYLRDVGIQWGGDGSFSAATGNPTGLAFPNRVGVVGGASDTDTPTAGLSPFQRNVQNPNFAMNLPATVGTGTGGALGLSFGSIDNTINLAVRLSAAESSGMLRILSSPRILTLDNREARISQGTLIPFSQISAQGVQTTFQEAKLQLLVKPHVTADGSVSMHVKINRDEPDFNQTSPRGDPTILKREAETDLLVMDGHTAVIGGIFTRNTGRNLDQVPFFGDIPLIGLLFQRRRASDSRGELVIFLTPRIVNRAEALGR